MNEMYMVAGIILLILGIIDFIWTTLWIEGGAGPVTRRLSTLLWKVMRKLSKDRAKILSLAGPFLLLLTVVTWVGLFWSGWTLFFASDPHSLVNTQDKAPATWTERFYFSGYVFFTLGNGDIVPNGKIWEIATVIATGTGMLLITFAVTYLLSVLNAVNQKRAFAQSVAGIGKSGIGIVQSAWNGKDFHNIDLLLDTFSTELSKLTAQHNAYPILHYYHSTQPEKSGIVAVTILDEALTLLKFGIPKEHGPNQLLLKEACSSVQNYLDTVQTAHINCAKEVPPYPNLAKLRQQGLPTHSDRVFQTSLTHLQKRRKTLLGIIKASARNWPLSE